MCKNLESITKWCTIKAMTKPYISVTSVKPLADYRLQVSLSDGRRGVFDVSPHLNKGVFKELRDPSYFKMVKLVFTGVGWPNGQDLSPIRIADDMRPLPRRAVARKSAQTFPPKKC